MPPPPSRLREPIEIQARRAEAEFMASPNRRTQIHVPHFIDRVWWDGVGHPRAVAPGGRLVLCVRGIGVGHGSGVDVTVRDSGGTFRWSRHVTLHRGHRALPIRVPRGAEGVLIGTVAIPRRDRPRWRAGLRPEDLAQVLPAVPIVRTRLREVRFGDDVASDGTRVRITAQADPSAAGRPASVELGRLAPLLGDLDGRALWMPVDGPRLTPVTDRGDILVDWVVDTATIDRARLWSQDAIEPARSQAAGRGPEAQASQAYRGIDLVARVRLLGLRSDSTEASPAGPRSTGTLAVRDPLRVQLIDGRTGAACAEQDVDLTLPDGEERTVTTDADGIAVLESVAPGLVCLTIPAGAPAGATASSDDATDDATDDASGGDTPGESGPPPPDAEATLALPVSSDPDAPYRAILTTGTPWNVAVRPRPAPAYTS